MMTDPNDRPDEVPPRVMRVAGTGRATALDRLAAIVAAGTASTAAGLVAPLPNALRPPSFAPPVHRPDQARGPITCRVSLLMARKVKGRPGVVQARDGRLYFSGVVAGTSETLRRVHPKVRGKAARRADKAARRAEREASRS
jgi:hypothetical protein